MPSEDGWWAVREGRLKSMAKDLEEGGVRMETGSMRAAETIKGAWVAQSRVLAVQRRGQRPPRQERATELNASKGQMSGNRILPFGFSTGLRWWLRR